MNEVTPSTSACLSTDTIQRYLDENQQLILAILENQNIAKLEDCSIYQVRLQQNLIHLANLADSQQVRLGSSSIKAPSISASINLSPSMLSTQSTGVSQMSPPGQIFANSSTELLSTNDSSFDMKTSQSSPRDTSNGILPSTDSCTLPIQQTRFTSNHSNHSIEKHNNQQSLSPEHPMNYLQQMYQYQHQHMNNLPQLQQYQKQQQQSSQTLPMRKENIPIYNEHQKRVFSLDQQQQQQHQHQQRSIPLSTTGTSATIEKNASSSNPSFSLSSLPSNWYPSTSSSRVLAQSSHTPLYSVFPSSNSSQEFIRGVSNEPRISSSVPTASPFHTRAPLQSNQQTQNLDPSLIDNSYLMHQPMRMQEGIWTREEHNRFLEGLEKFGDKDFRKIAMLVGSRNVAQVRTHFTRYRQKMKKIQEQSDSFQSKANTPYETVPTFSNRVASENFSNSPSVPVVTTVRTQEMQIGGRENRNVACNVNGNISSITNGASKETKIDTSSSCEGGNVVKASDHISGASNLSTESSSIGIIDN